jgi:hypothetical protein
LKKISDKNADDLKTCAKTIGDALSFAFDHSTGLMLPEINLKTLAAQKRSVNQGYILSELGTYQVEWEYLSQISGEEKYKKRIERMQSKVEV